MITFLWDPVLRRPGGKPVGLAGVAFAVACLGAIVMAVAKPF